MLKNIKKALSFADQLVFGFSTVCLVVLTVVAVIFRFVLNKPIAWGEEVQMLLVVWSVFFGASIAIREKGHIAVDVVFDILPAKGQKAFGVIIWILVAISIGAIAKLELDRVFGLIQSDLRTSILRIPSSVEYIGVVVACVLMLLNHIVVGIESLQKKEEALHD